MKLLVIACSLNQGSRSYRLAEAAAAAFAALGHPAQLINLREMSLPMCDAGESYGHADAIHIKQAVADADAVLLAVPIYNYDTNAAAKNLVELTGKAWLGKVVGFLCAAGGKGSYMSVMGLANSLMLDFRCVIVPRFVYATGADFDEAGEPQEHVTQRVAELAAETARVTRALTAEAAPQHVSRSL